MDKLDAFLAFVGTASTVYLILTAVIFLWGIFSGFLPVLVRLGWGLWNRKVAIVARGDNLSNLVALLTDSRLFKLDNIIRVAGSDQLEAIDRSTVILLHWADCGSDIEEILPRKKENTPLIIYAPVGAGRIPDEVMVRLETRKHVFVTNFRGRLMNDVVTSMITTSYEER